ncbi:cysteine desulfurase family protein [Lutimonas sp.]|uniref:cysteine desulfurase family protein n=1 Tax=Lutimonas sp. TaxID=1872403 RepID=UPI003D9AF6B0
MKDRIYLDYNATTPCAVEVVDAMRAYFDESFGNPSSIHHAYGWMAKDAIDTATNLIASVLNIDPTKIVYTSGSTEGINMILKSFSKKYMQRESHIITVKTEHKAVLDTCAFLEKYEGVSVTYLNVDTHGLIDLRELEEALRPETVLVSIMHANNETGVIQPLNEIAALLKNKDVLLFTDATQSLGKTELHQVLEVADYVCFSGHKVYGPKGVGMVYAKNQHAIDKLQSLIQGGGQQKKLRGGTLNATGIIGFSKAIELIYGNLSEEIQRLSALRDLLEEGLLEIELSTANGAKAKRLPNTTNISFRYVNGGNLLRALSKHMAISNGSACNAASENPSHVLTAMKVSSDLAFSSLRFSLGKSTTESDIRRAIQIIQDEVSELRSNNILWDRRDK